MEPPRASFAGIPNSEFKIQDCRCAGDRRVNGSKGPGVNRSGVYLTARSRSSLDYRDVLFSAGRWDYAFQATPHRCAFAFRASPHRHSPAEIGPWGRRWGGPSRGDSFGVGYETAGASFAGIPNSIFKIAAGRRKKDFGTAPGPRSGPLITWTGGGGRGGRIGGARGCHPP